MKTMNLQEELIFYTEKFKNLNMEHMGLLPGEKIKHCIDKKSFGGKYYHPRWVVTNLGRTWSLFLNDWVVPQIVKKKGCWAYSTKIPGKYTVYVHLLVLCYFADESDRIAVEEFTEIGVDGHHIRALSIPDFLKGRGHRQAKIDACMRDSRKSNLCYQERLIDHKNDTSMANGRVTSQERNGADVWDDECQSIRSMMYKSGQLKGNAYGTYYVYSYDEDGKLVKTVNQVLDLKGSLLAKNDVIIGNYKLNADEFKDVIKKNQAEILEQIKQNPPKSSEYHHRKTVLIDDIFVFYALNEVAA